MKEAADNPAIRIADVRPAFSPSTAGLSKSLVVQDFSSAVIAGLRNGGQTLPRPISTGRPEIRSRLKQLRML